MDLVKKYQAGEIFKEVTHLIRDYKVRELKEAVENEELLTLYRKFIRMCEELSNGIVIHNNSLSLAVFIDYMIQMGYFSYGKNIKLFKDGIDKELISKSGLSIVLGSGKCRHYASFTTDLFTKCGILCENFPTFLSNVTMRKTLSGAENHMANLVEYNGIYYVYDTFNHTFYEFRNPIELIEKTNSNDKGFLYYRPKSSLVFDKMDLEELERKLQDFKKSSEGNKISLKELYEIEKETKEGIKLNSKRIKDFANETNEVKKKMRVLSKKIRPIKMNS